MTKLKMSEEYFVPEDLCQSFKHFFQFGSITGIWPCSNSSTTSTGHLAVEDTKFSWRSFSVIRSIGISVLLTANTIVALIGLLTAKQIHSFFEFSYYAISVTVNAYSLFLYIFMLTNAKKLLALFKLWKETSFQYKYNLQDHTLARDANLIAGMILGSSVLENLMWAVKDSGVLNKYLTDDPATAIGYESIDPLEQYFKTYYQWRNIVPYNPWVAVYLFIANKWVIYSWNYCDVLIILIARALSMKFKLLNRQFEERLLHTGEKGHARVRARQDSQDLMDLIQDHKRLTELLYRFQELLSPLIFVSYFVNVYFVCSHLMFLTLPVEKLLGPEMVGPQNILTTIHLVWSAINLIMRLYLVSFMAAQVVDHGLNVKQLLQRSPPDAYNREVEKFEVQLEHMRPEFGLNGLGCFTITKSFMLDVFSVFFTIEIVLFQSSKLIWN